MPTDQQYEEEISNYSKPDLIRLWEDIQNQSVPVFWNTGRAFEYLILRAFQIEGAKVRWPFRVRLGSDVIEQIDGVVHFEHFSCVVEAKDKEEPVNADPIAKLYYILARRPAGTIGSVFTRSFFTDPAVVLAVTTAPQRVLLWSGAEIDYALRNEALRDTLSEKYRFIVEEGIALYNVLAEAY